MVASPPLASAYLAQLGTPRSRTGHRRARHVTLALSSTAFRTFLVRMSAYSVESTSRKMRPVLLCQILRTVTPIILRSTHRVTVFISEASFTPSTIERLIVAAEFLGALFRSNAICTSLCDYFNRGYGETR